MAADGDGSQPAAGPPIAPTLLEIQLFRALMTTPKFAWQWAELASQDTGPRATGAGSTPWAESALEGTTRGDDSMDRDGFRYPDDESRRDELDVSSQLPAQHVIDSAPQPSGIAAPGAPDLTYAELVEKHVRRALASATDDGAGGELQIELSDVALPGTALSLRRTSAGWQLLAISANKQSRETFARFAPTLVARFAQCSLGRLQVSCEEMGTTSSTGAEQR